MEHEQNASDFVNLYKQIRTATDSEQAAIAVLQELGKTQRALLYRDAEMRTEKPRGTFANGNLPATEKQIALMRVLKIAVPDGVTRADASRLIDRARN